MVIMKPNNERHISKENLILVLHYVIFLLEQKDDYKDFFGVLACFVVVLIVRVIFQSVLRDPIT